MNELQIFSNPQFGEIRTVNQNNEVWFVGKDVAEVLGYADASSAVSKNVDDEDKTTLLLQQDGSNYKSKTTIINESGLYSLVLSSKLPTAKAFKRWITSEVLPSIRRTGGYIPVTQDMTDMEILSRALQISQRTIEERNKQIAELEPKARYLDSILESDELLTTTQIAKDYGMTAYQLNKLLHGLGVEYKQNGQWLLYSKYQDKGYMQSITQPIGNGKTKQESRWTQEGKKFIEEVLRKHGVLRLSERGN